MAIFRDSPEMMAAISQVLQDPSTKIVAEFPQLDKMQMTAWLGAVLDFLKNNTKALGGTEYILRLNVTNHSSQILSAAQILASRKIGSNIIIINLAMKITGYDYVDHTAASSLSRYSRESASVLIHVLNGTDIIVYANGFVIKEMNANSPFSKPPAIKLFSRFASDYLLSIKEHYKQRVRFSQLCHHWGDKSKRLMIGGRMTEEVFHENLWNWLEEHLYGATVLGKVNKLSHDETDIEIRLLQGDFYIVEIKWLGDNGRTKYGEPRLRDAITQVKNYLIRDQDALEATVIAYDGRVLEDFLKLVEVDGEVQQWKEINQCLGESLPERGRAVVFYLESEDASKRK